MKTVGVFFGGRSAEHDVSIITGLQCIEQIKGHRIVPVYISREGLWYTGDLTNVNQVKSLCGGKANRCYLPGEPGACLCVRKKLGFGEKTEKITLDMAVLAMHGAHGEDGTLQGLFELCDIAYTCCGVAASAAGMDKITMKHIFRGAGLPVLPDVSFTRDEFDAGHGNICERVAALGYPVFVKPAGLGSSIGIGRAVDEAALNDCVAVAASFDRRILVEKSVENPREVNCSALGFGGDVSTSAIEEPMRASDFLSFDDKYLSGGKGGKSEGMTSLKRKLPADIPEETARRVREYTAACFKALDCKGVVRVDFLLDENMEVYINEINTIPGSMAYYLWEPEGITFPQLMDNMMAFAKKAREDKRKNHFAYESGILNQFTKGKK